MLFGVCTSLDNAGPLRAAGWDYVEENVQGLFAGTVGVEQWAGLAKAKGSALPIRAANCLVPGDLKITGPAADLEKLRAYMTNVTVRAKLCGVGTLVFGSGVARNVPEGFDRGRAREQVVAFLRMAAPLAEAQGVVVVVEHLNLGECNIITTVQEGLEYVSAVNHPNVQMLVDSYHLWLEDEPLVHVQAATKVLRHVHLADMERRVPPGESGKNDYRGLFGILKKAGYSGGISVEANGFTDFAGVGTRVLGFLRREWEAA